MTSTHSLFARLSLPIAWAFLAAVSTASPVPGINATANLAVNGDFSAATQYPGWPDGWQKEKDGHISWEAENGKHFVRLVSTQPNEYVEVAQVVAIPPGVKGLDYTALFRTSGVKFGKGFQTDARSRFQFLSATDQSVTPGVGDIVFDSHAKSWTEVERKFLVPEGAVKLKVMLCLNRPASGTLDVEEVRLSKMADSDVQALVMAPVLAAKKKAADEEEARKMLTLPPKTAEIKVSGNKLVQVVGGAPVWLQGVNVPSLGWTPKGEHLPESMKEALVDWKANAVRLPVYDGFWFGTGKPPQIPSNDAEAYRKEVDDAVAMAASQGAYVILDLHRFWIPEDRDVAFWKDAAARYKNNPAVLFDLFNEPGNLPWEVWRNGGDFKGKPKKGETKAPVFHTVGMQALVNAVRDTGARNIVIAGGIGSAYDLMGVLQGAALEDKTGNGIMYATHFYNWQGGWDKHFLPVAEKYPIFVGEFGADIKKMPFVAANKQEDPYTWMPDALGLMQKYKLNYTAFSLHPKATPVLIKDWDFEPTPFFGAFVKDALAGKQFEMRKMR